MAKFFGHIGFATSAETSPGVYENQFVERPYYGEIERNAVNDVTGETVLGDRKAVTSFRIVADEFANQNFIDMEYVKWRGRVWEVRQIEVHQRPRMIVRIGGVYNGPTASSEPSGGDSGV